MQESVTLPYGGAQAGKKYQCVSVFPGVCNKSLNYESMAPFLLETQRNKDFEAADMLRVPGIHSCPFTIPAETVISVYVFVFVLSTIVTV